MDEATTHAALTYESPRHASVPAADVGALGLRFLGIKYALDAVEQLPFAATILWSDRAAASAASIAIYVGWNLAIALGLLAFARPIAGVVFGRRDVAVADLGPASWMTLAVSGAGVTLAIFSAGTLAGIVAQSGLSLAFAGPGAAGVLVLPLAKIGVGLLFFFAPSLLVGPWVARVAPEPAEAGDA